MKKITVYFGNYGSGKTELSLNTAIELRKTHSDVTLVDLDVVTPYFRSSEHKAMLEQMGIRVVTPVFANTTVDVPSLPPDIYAAFKGGRAVFDCGGDPVGATVLGSLKAQFDTVREDTQALFVVNTRRPFQGSATQLKESLEKIEARARLKADGMVFNANLGAATTGQELAEGYAIVKAFEKETGLPLLYVSGTADSLRVFAAQCPDCRAETIALTIRMQPDWLRSN